MASVPTRQAVRERRKWLGDVSDVLQQAQQILAELSAEAVLAPFNLDLAMRIQAALFEADTLHNSHSLSLREQFDPEWIKSTLWCTRQPLAPQSPAGKSPPPTNGAR